MGRFSIGVGRGRPAVMVTVAVTLLIVDGDSSRWAAVHRRWVGAPSSKKVVAS